MTDTFIRGWPQTWKTWSTWGFLRTWKTQNRIKHELVEMSLPRDTAWVL